MVKACVVCGRELDAEARFCDGCGSAQPEETIEQHEISTSQRGPSRVRVPAILLIGLTIGFAAGAVVFTIGHAPVGGITLQTQTVTITAGSGLPASASKQLVQYCFSPGGNCASIIVGWINRANSSVHVLIYSFTLNSVRDALIQAKNRGVDVKVVMASPEASVAGSEYRSLRNAGVDVRLDLNSELMHNKVAIIDGHVIITGSFNWTESANARNNENLVVVDNTTWAAAFENDFQGIYNSSSR